MKNGRTRGVAPRPAEMQMGQVECYPLLPHPASPGTARPSANGAAKASAEPLLTDQHLADLHKSGLSDETIAACGFRSIRGKEAWRPGWKYRPATWGDSWRSPFSPLTDRRWATRD